jgi:hypothetical protein
MSLAAGFVFGSFYMMREFWNIQFKDMGKVVHYALKLVMSSVYSFFMVGGVSACAWIFASIVKTITGASIRDLWERWRLQPGRYDQVMLRPSARVQGIFRIRMCSCSISSFTALLMT